MVVPFPSPHLRPGSGNEGTLLEFSMSRRPFKGEQLLSFVSVSAAAACKHILACCSLGLCYYTLIAVLSIAYALPINYTQFSG